MILQEFVELILIGLLGSLPAAALSNRFDAVSKFALAPVMGFAVGIDLFTSTLRYWPGDRTSWLLPFLDAVSLVGAVLVIWRRHDLPGRPTRRTILRAVLGGLQLLMVCALISAPYLWSFHEAHSNGPVAYQVQDAIVYINEADGAQLQSLPTASAESNKGGDQLISFWASYVQANQRLDAAPLLANIDGLLGWHATGTEGSFLLVVLIIGGLGVLAGVRYFLKQHLWVGSIAGALFGGAFFQQLYFDGSQAALCALVLLVPMLAIGIAVFREKRVMDCVAVAFLLAAFLSAYPLFTPEIGAATAAVIAVFVLRRLLPKYHAGALRAVILGAACALGTAALTIGFNTVGYNRMLYEVQNYSSSISGQPNYSFLVPRVLPSWLSQTQVLYGLALSSHPVIEDLLLALVAPLIIVAFIALAVRRNPILLVAGPLVGAFILLAVYARVHTYSGFPNGCSYCEDRNLLPVVPIILLLSALGFAGFLTSRRQPIRVIAVAALTVVLGSVAYTADQAQQLFESGSYFLPNSITDLLSQIPANSQGAIQAEGFDEAAPNPVAEMSFVYLAIDERFPGRASWAAGNNENGDQTYFFDPTPSLADLRYQPLYQYVLTRIAGVKTNRKLIAKSGSIGLYRRANPLDVTVDYGLSVTYPSSAVNETPTPNIFNPEPMQFIASGGVPRRKAYVRLTFTKANSDPTVSASDGSSVRVRSSSDRLSVCLTTAGVAPARTATVTVDPISGTQLLRMGASYRPC